ncbi:Acetoacetyl-CoA synthetase [Mycena sanguinolenta]|uniref:Acetoacetyl-CoA synthetase n=1 Tax=Mycena sanguinolenta TaxID=230812 RepID=A0A8H6YC28_9AGAR|nr:Acetoacetyl-CoA synthetase [Mycena sanguinolenta]
MPDDTPLHRPRNPEASAVFAFRDRVNAKYGLALRTYHDLWLWSISHVSLFWSETWDATNIIGEKGTHVVDESVNISENPPWFTDACINWAENMLTSTRSSEKVALIQPTEPTPLNPNPELRRCTYAQLYDLVSRLVSSLLANGLKPGDRVASYSSNCIENVALCLATTAIGAIWVSAAADFGPAGVLERFEQVQPKFIFAVDAFVYNAKVHEHLPKLTTLLLGLAAKSLDPAKVVIIHSIPYAEDRSTWQEGWLSWQDFLLEGEAKKLGRNPSGEILWHRASFNWPLWILFSSGSTGKPNGWMMYNFLISGLSVGCTLVLFDGSPLRDPAFLWKLTDDLKISIFGTSAKYIEQLAKRYKPRYHHNLSSLRHIYSTGSPLSADLFRYVYEHIHPDILLGSITGGTDICSLFAGMVSGLPVYAGEIQCRMLGLAVESYSEAGTLNAPDEPGELVCLKKLPMHARWGFWRTWFLVRVWHRRASRGRKEPGTTRPTLLSQIWRGNTVIIVASHVRGLAMAEGWSCLGGQTVCCMQDMNPGGVRFGSSELYDAIDSAFCAAGKIVDSLAVGLAVEGDERVVLFVKLPR